MPFSIKQDCIFGTIDLSWFFGFLKHFDTLNSVKILFDTLSSQNFFLFEIFVAESQGLVLNKPFCLFFELSKPICDSANFW